MAKTIIRVDVTKLTKSCVMSVEVHITRRFKLRLTIATVLIKAAAWILNCGIKIERPSDIE